MHYVNILAYYPRLHGRQTNRAAVEFSKFKATIRCMNSCNYNKNYGFQSKGIFKVDLSLIIDLVLFIAGISIIVCGNNELYHENRQFHATYVCYRTQFNLRATYLSQVLV